MDIARDEIFTGEEEFRPDQLEDLMEMALVENKATFVELLLVNGLKIKPFLTERRLLYLYNCSKVNFYYIV